MKTTMNIAIDCRGRKIITLSKLEGLASHRTAELLQALGMSESLFKQNGQ